MDGKAAGSLGTAAYRRKIRSFSRYGLILVKDFFFFF